MDDILVIRLHYTAKVKWTCRYMVSSVDFELIKREIIFGGPDLSRWALKKPIQVFPKVRGLKHQKCSSFGLEEAQCCVWGGPYGREWQVASGRGVPSFTIARNRILSTNKGWVLGWSLSLRWDHNLLRPWAKDPVIPWLHSWPTETEIGSMYCFK